MTSEPLCVARNIFGVEMTPLCLSCRELLDGLRKPRQPETAWRAEEGAGSPALRKTAVVDSLHWHRPGKDIMALQKDWGDSLCT